MDDHGATPLYEYLYQCIRDDILNGELAAEEHLPSKRSFAQHLGVSLITVENAYAQLVAEGYVHARERRGYYVCAIPVSAALQHPGFVPAQAPAASAPPSEAVGAARAGSTAAAPSAIADFTRPALRSNASAASLWSRTLRSALVQEPQEELYAAAPAAGCLRLRRAIARYLHQARGMQVDASCVVIGAGAQVLYSAIALLTGAGSSVALEDPGYPRLYRTYEAHGLSCVPVPLDADGMVVEGLTGSDCRLAHVMPSHQFPTGRPMGIARRYELLSWALAGEGRFIVEDDYDWEFRFAGRPIPALQSIDAAGRVIYVSTFSKSLSSALRIAFAVIPPQLMDRYQDVLGPYSSTVSSIDQVALARLIESQDYERHLMRYRRQSRLVRDALIDTLRASAVGKGLQIEQEDSGLHFVLALASGKTEKEIAAAAKGRGVLLAPYSSYARERENAGPGDGRTRFVMQYDGLDPDKIDEVVYALERAVLD